MTRYFEGFQTGDRFDLGSVEVTEEDILAFATRWDPQLFHTDHAAAAATPFGGLIASGIHTLAMFMQLFATGLLCDSASLGSPGMDEVRWPAPVRPLDVLTGSYVVQSARPSASRPGWGVVQGRGELTNQTCGVVLAVTVVNMLGREEGSGADGRG